MPSPNMSTAHHLRSVSDFAHSPATTASTISPTDHSPHHKTRPSPRQARRPLTPSSLRDVDLTQASESLPRNPNYPAPPTGHDLMAMFPPAPPDNIPEMRPGPTSGFFQRQERAFFAQAGKEIVRVCVDVDVGHGNPDDPVKSRIGSSSTRSWSSAPGPPGTTPFQPPVQASPAPYPHPSSRPRINVNPSMYPASTSITQTPPPHHPVNSGVRTPPQDMLPSVPPIQKAEFTSEDFPTEESWRRPMPYAERRRAGKHTRRVLRT